MSIIEKLAYQHSTSPDHIRAFSKFAPHHYKVYTIPKRSVGHRVIAHPSRKLKALQRSLNTILSEILPVHDAAYAYRKNVSIKDNAIQHLRSSYLLKMDFHNYFLSITPKLFWQKCDDNSVAISATDRATLERLIFWCPSKRLRGKLVLSVGAPTSPLISNFVAYEFDRFVTEYCHARGVTYTRYSDDLSFTTDRKGVLFEFPHVISKALRDTMFGRVSVNESKTVFSSKAHNRHITGITLTSDDRLSIGRERKRYISALIHKYSIGQLSVEDRPHLQGLISFAVNIEPEFISRMEKKYSKNIINSIFRSED